MGNAELCQVVHVPATLMNDELHRNAVSVTELQASPDSVPLCVTLRVRRRLCGSSQDYIHIYYIQLCRGDRIYTYSYIHIYTRMYGISSREIIADTSNEKCDKISDRLIYPPYATPQLWICSYYLSHWGSSGCRWSKLQLSCVYICSYFTFHASIFIRRFPWRMHTLTLLYLYMHVCNNKCMYVPSFPVYQSAGFQLLYNIVHECMYVLTMQICVYLPIICHLIVWSAAIFVWLCHLLIICAVCRMLCTKYLLASIFKFGISSLKLWTSGRQTFVWKNLKSWRQWWNSFVFTKMLFQLHSWLLVILFKIRYSVFLFVMQYLDICYIF